MKDEKAPIKNFKPALILLFKHLGLNVQASNIERNVLDQGLTYLEAYVLFKKHQVDVSVQKCNKHTLRDLLLPFIWISEEGIPQVMRLNNGTFESLDERNHWAVMSKSLEGGYVFLVDSLPDMGKKSRFFATQYAKLTKWYRPVFWLSLLSSLTGLAIPLFTMAVYDRVIAGHAPQILPNIAAGAVIALAVLVVSRILRSKIVTISSNRFSRDLSSITFNRLLSMPLSVLSRVGLANHMSRIRNTENIRKVMAGPAGSGLLDLPFSIVVLLTIALLSGWLVVVPIVMLALFYLVMKLVEKYVKAATPTISNEYQSSFNELSKNILYLKAAGEPEGWYNDFMRRAKENSRQNFNYTKRSGLNAAIAHAMGLITVLVTVFTGIYLTLNQSITPGALIACTMLIWRITGPAQLAFSARQKIAMVKGTASQFDRFMEVPTEFSAMRLELPDIKNPPSMSFKHVTLRYSAESEPALSGVNFDISPGEIVAVIGPNGSGKTSLLLSALGVLEPQAGYVMVNGKNCKQYDTEALRRWAAYSPTHADIIPGSLAQNIRVACPEATDDEVREALIKAGAGPILKALNNDVNAEVFGKGASVFSSVESGYVGLAVALAKRSSLLVLDEPIANRNPEAKRDFISTLTQLKGNTTVLFSSHDKDLIHQADKVIILDKGSVVYTGPIMNKENEAEKAVEQGEQNG
ncbi:peptidase domain-containing ABC transporter [Vibrio pacinii]|uniref:peptidase domain-containing ABC transporter n=1 Tax=Vibrio pacinii TaxID=170674 RepID=UPI00056F2F1D|nr:ATP-binding cassette domain-containing protein [Vibrio pacinii]